MIHFLILCQLLFFNVKEGKITDKVAYMHGTKCSEFKVYPIDKDAEGPAG